MVGRFDGFSVKLGTGTMYIFVPNHFDGQKYFNLPFFQPALLCEILNCVILGLGGQWTLWANQWSMTIRLLLLSYVLIDSHKFISLIWE